jgi:hypothetical protein
MAQNQEAIFKALPTDGHQREKEREGRKSDTTQNVLPFFDPKLPECTPVFDCLLTSIRVQFGIPVNDSLSHVHNVCALTIHS